MTLRRAGPADAARIEAFLAQHPLTSMFLRSNLAQHGTEEAEAPQGTAFYVTQRNGTVSGVFGLTNHGFGLAQAPAATAQDWADYATAIRGRRFRGITGVPDQVEAALVALNLDGATFSHRADEPLYHLTLSQMTAQDALVRLARAADIPLLERWFAAYEVDVGQAQPGAAPSVACKQRAVRAVGNPEVALFQADGHPVAMAGINARVDDTIQIGGVFTPVDLRGRGYARRALAGLLRRWAQRGVTQSILFAFSPPAARAYEALGYVHVGAYRTALLRAPVMIGETP